MPEKEKCDIHGKEIPFPKSTGKLYMVSIIGWDKEMGQTHLQACVECLKNKGDRIIEELEKGKFE